MCYSGIACWDWSISSSHPFYPIHMHSLLCLWVATPHLSPPHDTCGLSGLSHTNLLSAGHLPGLHILWCIIKVRYPNQEVGATRGFFARSPCNTTHEWHMVLSS